MLLSVSVHLNELTAARSCFCFCRLDSIVVLFKVQGEVAGFSAGGSAALSQQLLEKVGLLSCPQITGGQKAMWELVSLGYQVFSASGRFLASFSTT